MNESSRKKLMWASFITLVASGVGFAVRTAMGGVWGAEFNIGGQEFGKIMGAGFLGFGMMIFFGGVLTEKFGYKKLLFVAFALHLISGVLLFIPRYSPDSAFTILYWSVFLFSIAQGLYEAVINPLIAQIYPENKTHYLNILHAGWPAGMIIGGLLAASFVGDSAWIANLSYWEIPLASFVVLLFVYAGLAFPEDFPETVGEKSAGNWSLIFSCFSSPVFLLLIILHACIGYVELGVDSWTTNLMKNLLPNSILILVYTSFLMFILRFFAGPIVHKINPIGLLFVSSVIGCLGLFWLGTEITSVLVIFVAATFYSLGKAFFWPTMLGVAGERYPQSGSVAMGALGAAGMLTVGLIAGEAIGYKQASNASAKLADAAPETYSRYQSGEDKGYLFLPKYRPLSANYVATANSSKKDDSEKFDVSGYFKLLDPELNELALTDPDAFKEKMKKPADELLDPYEKTAQAKLEEIIAAIKDAGDDTSKAEKLLMEFDTNKYAEKKKIIELIKNAEKDIPAVQAADIYGGRRALTLTAMVPASMAVGFLILLLYFKSIGGYKVLEVADDGTVREVGGSHGKDSDS